MDKYIGRLLDNRYEILEVIGTGGMAVVYKAKCHRLNRMVAIKILKDDFMEDEEFRRRFHSESQAVAMLSHPNIISVYDVSTSVTADYIVMELIDGITLKQYMEKKGVLNWKETLHFAIQIAKALEHAHGRGIVHRDIKPHNVMVLKNGSVKVTDFGIARVMAEGNTLTKEALGSVHYISPEQAKGSRVDNRSDIYSLGVVMYEMMSGKPPYDGESPVAVAVQHINGGAVMPSTINPNIPGGLEQIIMRAMAHEPENRYASATQMLADLDEFRKDPAILFDYNIPPTDEVTNMPKPAAIEEQPPVVPLVAEEEETKESNGDMPVMIPRNRDEQEDNAAVATAEPAPAPEVVVIPKPAQPKKRPPQQQPRQPQKRPPQQAAPRRTARDRYEEEEARRNKVTTIAIISCVLVMVVAIAIILSVMLFKNGDTQVVVPDFVGKIYEQLDEKDYDFHIFHEEVFSDEVDAGKIVSQEPPAGTLINKNGTVQVFVSKGPDGSNMPTDPPVSVTMLDLRNKSEGQAKQILNGLVSTNEKLNLSYEIIYEYNSEMEKGKVFKTEPGFGEILIVNKRILVYVSDGKDPDAAEIMGDFTNAEVDVTRKTLENLEMNLSIKEMPQASDDVEVGYVCGTSPAAGQPLHPGQEVIIYISSGPKTFIMPNLMVSAYRDISNAKGYLQMLGYNMSKLIINEVWHDTEPVGTLLSQSEPAGTDVSVNAEITLTVSKGPKPPTTWTGYVLNFNVSALDEQLLNFGACKVTVYDSNGNVVVDAVDVPKGSKSCTITLTGKGKQTFTYSFESAIGGTQSGKYTFEVNFDEYEEQQNNQNNQGTGGNGENNPVT